MRAAQQFLGGALASKPRQQRPCGAQRVVVAQAATQQVTRKPVPLELEKGDLPMNTFSPKKPFKATIKSVERIVGPKATGETCHIILETRGEIPFWEGQSYGIVPPVRPIVWSACASGQVCGRCSGSRRGRRLHVELDFCPGLGQCLHCRPEAVRCGVQGTKVNSKGKEVAHGARLYSIAASRYGDNFDGKTTSLCVRRATYWCPEMKAEDPAKKGLCSNFLCDAKPGDEVTMTGALCRGALLDSLVTANLLQTASHPESAPSATCAPWCPCDQN